jgi:hypothetical protein
MKRELDCETTENLQTKYNKIYDFIRIKHKKIYSKVAELLELERELTLREE